MKIAVTGATGLVGQFIAAAVQAAGHQVAPLSGWRLGEAVDLAECDALIHAAFAHEPGKYRGGEGDDPARFTRLNLDGTTALFHAARSQGVGHVVFVSSRAVYDGYPAGTPLPDGTPVRPESLYGQIKAQAELVLDALATPDFLTASIRATGVYGPGAAHKWCGLFRDYLSGQPIAPRVATELHGDDLASAVLAVIGARARGAFNASDLLLDRHDLLAEVAASTGATHPLPSCADGGAVSVMTCERLAALGWTPGGMARLRADLPKMIAQAS